MPKLPPPPRIAQKSSVFAVALAVTSSPEARRTSASSRLSMVRPCLRVRWPTPPPTARPAIPVVPKMPVGTASPNACVAWSRSARVQPGSTRTVLSVWVYTDPAQPSEVDDETVINGREARAMVAAASNRDLQAVVDPETESRLDVTDIDWPGDERRPPIHGGVEHAPRIVVARVVAPDQLSSEARLQRGEGRLVERRMFEAPSPCHASPIRTSAVRLACQSFAKRSRPRSSSRDPRCRQARLRLRGGRAAPARGRRRGRREAWPVRTVRDAPG